MFKFLNRRKKKGQSTLEYAILIIIIIGALLSIQIYIKRGVQGRLKQATDDIGDQFSPGNMNVIKKHTVNSYISQTATQQGQGEKLLKNETTIDLMNAYVIQQNQEYWGN